MKFLLVGNGPRSNRGCEAISITTVEILSRFFSHARIKMLSFNPDEDSLLKELDVEVSLALERPIRKETLTDRVLSRLRLQTEARELQISSLRPYVQELKDCDLVLSLGGDNYSDDYGVPYLFWELAEWARSAQRPFVIWGASVGPFKNPHSLQLAKRHLGKVDLITAREDLTVQYLKEINYGGTVIRVYDSAFLLSPRAVPTPVPRRDAKTVGINVSPIYCRYTSMTPEEVMEIVRRFAWTLAKDYNVLLIPHVMIPSRDHNDALYMESIVDLERGIQMVDSSYDCRQLKHVISQCDYFIGTRTHATIAAFSSCIPTLSLTYSMKGEGLNYDLFGDDSFVLRSTEFGFERLVEKFEYLVQRADEARSALEWRQGTYNSWLPETISTLESLIEKRS